MVLRRLRRALALTVAAVVLPGCAGGATAAPSPSPSHPAPEVQLPEFNSRMGSNRIAAEAAAGLGRKLYSLGQYWEVYVRTTPPALPGKYDPVHPEAAAPAAGQVTSAELVIATEAGATVRKFTALARPRQQGQLADLEQALRQSFPALTTVTMRIFFGESYQYATVVFDHGRLAQFDVRQ